MATVNVFRTPAAGGAPVQVALFAAGTTAAAILQDNRVIPLPASGSVAISLMQMGVAPANAVTYGVGTTPLAGNYLVVDGSYISFICHQHVL